MKYFLLITLFFPQGLLMAGSFSSETEAEIPEKALDEEKKAHIGKTMMQILPIKINRKDMFIEGQLTKMAVRHISKLDKYELAIGQVNPKLVKSLEFENLDIRVSKGRLYALELRIFELQRNTLVKKVEASSLRAETFLQDAEKMFEDLFLGMAIDKEPKD